MGSIKVTAWMTRLVFPRKCTEIDIGMDFFWLIITYIFSIPKTAFSIYTMTGRW